MEKSGFIQLPNDVTPLVLQGDIMKSLHKIP